MSEIEKGGKILSKRKRERESTECDSKLERLSERVGKRYRVKLRDLVK